LISIALVAEDGREFYAVSSEFDPAQCSAWVRENVLPKIQETKDRLSRKEIAKQIVEFVGDNPEFWAYFADYDWVVFCWLFGTMMDLPKHFPKFCLDLEQVMHERGIDRDELPRLRDDLAHDALMDARWNRDVYWLIYG